MIELKTQETSTVDVSGTNSTAHRSVGSFVVIGPKSMAAQLLCHHLGAGAPQHWDDVDVPALNQTDVVIIDGSLGTDHPGLVSCIFALRRAVVGVVVAFCEAQELVQAQWIEYGVQALVAPTASLDELGDVIRRVRRKETVLGISVREALLCQLRNSRQRNAEQTSLFAGLTRREASVLRSLANGKSPEEVAGIHYVSLNTIRTQIRGILAKVGTGSVVGAVALAYRSGWIATSHEAHL